MRRATVPVVIVLALLSCVHANYIECLQSYQEFVKNDFCLANIPTKDPSKMKFPHLVTGEVNLRDGTCFKKGASDSIKTQCQAKPNEVLELLVSAGDATCAADSPTTVEFKVDGQCNQVEVDGATLFYKATPVPPPPVCFDKYEEFASEGECKFGGPLADDSTDLTLAKLVGQANKGNLKHHSCQDADPNSLHTVCTGGSLGPDKKMRYEQHVGDKQCAATGSAVKSVELEVTATCKSAQKPDGSGLFFYKASPAKCFNWYAEFAQEIDCKNNKNEVTGAAVIFPFLVGAQNNLNSYDKKCSVKGGNAYRTTCGEVSNGAKVAGVPDKEAIIERYSTSSCDIQSSTKTKSTHKLVVDGTCKNFEWEGKTIWYKAVQTTDAKQVRPGAEPPLGDGAKCTDNKITGDTTNDGKRCIEWEKKPLVCKSMGFSNNGFGTGLYFKRGRIEQDKAPKSNLCKVTCIDRGDVFCVDKKDLESNPVCCPKECNDPDNGGQNMCSATLKAIGTHVCSDQLTSARDEFKYLLCPRESMNNQCGKKVHKFDVKKNKKETFTFKAPWYKPNDPVNNPTNFPVFNFDKQGICNYVFIMPDKAAYGSSFELKFKGSEQENNINTQAYYASYISGDEEKQPALGDILAKYDGKWDYKIPPNADDATKNSPADKGLLQTRAKAATNFLELEDLLELNGKDPEREKIVKHTLSQTPESNTTIAFVSIMTSFTQKNADQIGNNFKEDMYKKEYNQKGGSFQFTVNTNFRPSDEGVARPTDEEIDNFERAQKEKRDEVLFITLIVLAGVFALVLLILIFQNACNKHTELEYQKRLVQCKKEDVNIRATVKRRTLAQQRKASKPRYSQVSKNEQQIVDENVGGENDLELDLDNEERKEEDPANPNVGPSNISNQDLDEEMQKKD